MLMRGLDQLKVMELFRIINIHMLLNLFNFDMTLTQKGDIEKL